MIKLFVWSIVNLISMFGVTYFYCKLCNVKLKISFFVILWTIVGSICLAILQIYNLTILSTLLYFLFYPILFNNFNKTNFDKQVYYTFVVWMCGMLLDCLAMMAVLILNNFIDFNIYSYFSRVVLTLIVFVMILLLSHIKVFTKFVNTLYIKVKKINFFDFTLIAFAIFVLLMSVAIFLTLDNIKMSILLLAILFLLGFSFSLMIGVRINLIENTKFLKLLKANNDFYLKIEDENRIFKHNLMAKMLSIKSVSGKKSRELIDDFLKSFNKNIDFSIHIQDMPYGLNGIIYEKIYPYIGKLHIKIDNKINFDIFTKLKPRRYNVFVEKMIIALDNAIESSVKSSDKLLVINLYSEDNCIVIDIKNTFSNSVNLDELGTINYSTNGKKRGLGLFSALREKEINMSIKIVNDLFVTKIVAKQNLNVEE